MKWPIFFCSFPPPHTQCTFAVFVCLRFWSFDSIDGIIRCIHLGWTKYHVTEGLVVKSTTCHGNAELFKAGRLSPRGKNVWPDECLTIIFFSSNAGRSQMVKSVFPAFNILRYFLHREKKFFIFLCPLSSAPLLFLSQDAASPASVHQNSQYCPQISLLLASSPASNQVQFKI